VTGLYDLVCPLPTGASNPPKCGKDLHIVWTTSRPLSTADLIPPQRIEPGDGWAQEWRVECEDGHIIAVPGDNACPHYPGGDEPTEGHVCDVDPDEAYRTFGPRDARRVYAALARINAAPLPPAPGDGADNIEQEGTA
jgi:hypothetical protein